MSIDQIAYGKNRTWPWNADYFGKGILVICRCSWRSRVSKKMIWMPKTPKLDPKGTRMSHGISQNTQRNRIGTVKVLSASG